MTFWGLAVVSPPPPSVDFNNEESERSPDPPIFNSSYTLTTLRLHTVGVEFRERMDGVE